MLHVDEDYAKLACPRCAERSPKKLISSFRTNTWPIFLDRMERKVSPHKLNRLNAEVTFIKKLKLIASNGT